ncbi:nucleotide sugar transporter family protein [Nannochloropsis oceanica]
MISGVGIVILNKYIVTEDTFDYVVFLSFCHYFFTMVFFGILAKARYITPKQIPIDKRVTLAMASLGSIVFMNLSLASNSVGFYQLSKLACIPVIIVTEYVLYERIVPLSKLLTVTVIIFGVAVASVNDVTINLIGLILAAVAVCFTSMAQILCSHYQKYLECDSMQLLHSTCPLVTFGMLVFIPFFHNVQELALGDFSAPLLTHIFWSCVLALGVNITNFSILGKTSPLAYQILGHLKATIILILGVVIFNYQYNAKVIAGTVLALGGVVAYTELGRQKLEDN